MELIGAYMMFLLCIIYVHVYMHVVFTVVQITHSLIYSTCTVNMTCAHTSMSHT